MNGESLLLLTDKLNPCSDETRFQGIATPAIGEHPLRGCKQLLQ